MLAVVGDADFGFAGLPFRAGRAVGPEEDFFRQVGGGRVFALRVAEDERVIELDFAIERERLLEVVFGFSGKTDDKISADSDARTDLPQFANDFENRDECAL